MSDALLVLVFVLGATVSLATSWVLVSRIERVGARLGLTEALLGMLAALAADAPEVTAAVTALVGRHGGIGAGVVIGSNVFNLAALLGVSALVAGTIALHRRVIALEAAVAVPIAVMCVLVVIGAVSPVVGLLLAIAVLAPYVFLLGVRRDRLANLRLPRAWTRWLTTAIHEEELELEDGHPRRGGSRDLMVAAISVVVVVAASVIMERAASEVGTRHGIPDAVLGGLILAGVTSLPNAVAAVYLARRGRGAATLSTAMNSNALNVALGLLLPASFAGLATGHGPTTLMALYYLGMTLFVLANAYARRGLERVQGALIVGAYAIFVGMVLATA